MTEPIPPVMNAVPKELNFWQRLALWPLAGLIKLWNATIRLEVSDEDIRAMEAQEPPFVCLMWHNRLFTVGEAYKRFVPGRKLVCLVSASKDGAWLSALFRMLGMEAVRGSSSKRSFTATRELLTELKSGSDIGITPDGPRGPCYDFKEGAVMLARQAKAPLLFLSIDYSVKCGWRLKSWDRFWIPKPFSRLQCRLITIPRETVLALPQDRESAARALAERLMAHTKDS